MFGITINGKHTFDDYGLKMTKMIIPMPKVKTKTIDIPFGHGNIDLTDYNGGVHYEDREGVLFEFILYDKKFSQWAATYSKLANDIHGKKLRVILDNDKTYFYNMRLSVSSEKSKKPLSKITITGTAEPFKYELFSSSEPWEWDPFNFETGEITFIGSIDIDGTESMAIQKGTAETSPTFIVRNIPDGQTLYVNDGIHNIKLSNGTNYDPRIKVSGSKDVTLTFTGKGAVQVDYRRGSL